MKQILTVTQFTGLDMEMEIKESYQEVLHMLEGVLLHIFRGIKGSSHDLYLYLAQYADSKQRTAPMSSSSFAPSTPARSSSSPKPARKSASASPKPNSSSAPKAPRSTATSPTTTTCPPLRRRPSAP